ncbi:MAG: hypothetical protein PHC68_08965 [Syntrophorhabdaceae bacterium]|nr:hypothetical protein [Syntrophorhabdaceae bacterium]
MQLHAGISSIQILEKVLSVRFAVSLSFDDIEELKNLKKYDIIVSIFLDGRKAVWFRGRITSLGMRERVSIVVHTAINKTVINRLVDIHNKDCLVNVFRAPPDREGASDGTVHERSGNPAREDPASGNLEELVETASRMVGMAREELIERLTGFEKNGRVVTGKKRLEDVSDKQKPIMLDRIRRLLTNGYVRDKYFTPKDKEDHRVPEAQGDRVRGNEDG